MQVSKVEKSLSCNVKLVGEEILGQTTSFESNLLKFFLHFSFSFFFFEHGLRTTNESFFSLKSRTFGLGQTNWSDNLWMWGTWGTFDRFISIHFGTVSPLSIFSNNQLLLLQKTRPLYPHPKYLFGIGIWISAEKN